MRRSARRSLLSVLIAASAIGALAAPATGGEITKVKMVDGNRFRPGTVTIARGTVVKWVNRDNHDHTSTGPGWNRRLDPGDAFRRTFNEAGTFAYRCTIHASMRGTIVVE